MYVMFCIFCFIVLFCVLFVSMCTVLLPPGVNPIAFNKYIYIHTHTYGRLCLRNNELLNYRTETFKTGIFRKLMTGTDADICRLLSTYSLWQQIVFTTTGITLKLTVLPLSEFKGSTWCMLRFPSHRVLATLSVSRRIASTELIHPV